MPAPSPQRYTLWRQDDNGVQAPVAHYATLPDAQRALTHYESLGHKQHYWVADNERTADKGDHSQGKSIE